MKITETVTRECCEPKDLLKHRGAMSRSYPLDLHFCKHCGELWVLEVFKDPVDGWDSRFARLFPTGSPFTAFMELAEHGGAWVSSAECSGPEIATARSSGKWFQIDSAGFVHRTAEWLKRVALLDAGSATPPPLDDRSAGGGLL